MRSTSTSSRSSCIDIQKSFTVDRALAGALGTVTLVMRLVGGVAAGTAADKWGRKLPLMLSILWFSLFAFLSGFSTSYAMLFALRALFGIGMGGEWAAGMPLVLEHWPAQLRGIGVGAAARRLVLGLSVRRRRVPVRLSAIQRHARHRLARDVLDCDHPGAAHAVDPRDVHGEPRLARAAAPAASDRAGARPASRRVALRGSSSAT